MKKLFPLCLPLFAFLLLIFEFAHAQIPSYVPTNGLVGWWPFNGNANDESGNGNNGTVNGATLTTDRFGNVGKAYRFNGSNDFIQTNYEGILGKNKRTVSLWVSTIYNSPMCALSWGSEETGGRFDAYFNFNGTGATANLSNAAMTYGTNSSVNDGQWHHYVFLINNSNPILSSIEVYQDGNRLNSIVTSYNPNISVNTISSVSLRFGKTIVTTMADFFNGNIDDIAIYNRALTQQEITSLYQSQSCSFNISQEPTNQTASLFSNTSFSVQTNTDCTTSVNYQWQTNMGLGWQNLFNAGQYGGVNTNTLTVSNISGNNSQQQFRCIASTGTVSDTSNMATLTVLGGINSSTNYTGAPKAIPYQAALRKSNGMPLINHSLKLKISLLDSSSAGNVVYQEVHTLTTNGQGLFSAFIGTGNVLTGNFNNVAWAVNKKFIRAEIDTTANGSSYTDLGTQQLMSVPYALYAETSGSSLSGPQGEKGDRGEQGLQGATGPQGPQGPAGQGFQHYVGEYFGGGVVFFVTDSGQHGLIASLDNQSDNSAWYNNSANGFIITASVRNGLYAGKYNTERIIITQRPGEDAASKCAGFQSDSFGDWYLPSVYEMQIMFQQKNIITGLSNGNFWCLNEYINDPGDKAFALDISNGEIVILNKDQLHHVRAIRAF